MFDASAIDMLPVGPVGFHSLNGRPSGWWRSAKKRPRRQPVPRHRWHRCLEGKKIEMDLNGVGYPLAHKLRVLEMYGNVATCRWLTSSTGTSWRSAQPKNIIIYILIKNVEIFIPMFFFQMAHRPKNPAVDSGRRLGRKGSSKGPQPAAAKPSGGSPRSCRWTSPSCQSCLWLLWLADEENTWWKPGDSWETMQSWWWCLFDVSSFVLKLWKLLIITRFSLSEKRTISMKSMMIHG